MHTWPQALPPSPSAHQVNHQVCPWCASDKVLKNGDIVNLDITTIKDRYHGDTSRMFYVGEPSIQARRLCEASYLRCGAVFAREAGQLSGDIGYAIQSYVEGLGYSVVREFCAPWHRQCVP